MTEKTSLAFLLIDCEIDAINNIIDELNQIDAVKEFERLDNPWKIIIKLEANTLDKIREAIAWKIRKLSGINATLTLVEYMR
jgi:nitrate reductase NapAB chaperone NapD